MKKFAYIFIISLIVFLCSCNEVATGPAVPGSTGTTYELIVACPDKAWDGPIGDTLRNFFGQLDETMFMREELYNLVHIDKETLENNKMFSFSKSILIVDVVAGVEPKAETKKNMWAKPQRVYRFTVPDSESFIELFGKYQNQMLESYYDIEREKLNAYYKTALNRSVIESVGKKFGYTFNITTGFRIAKNYSDFMWLRSETDKTSTNILIYEEDYTDENQLQQGYILLKRDLMTKQHVPASMEGSYAKVSEVFPVVSEVTNINGLYAVETRGAWDCENDFMGGTFLNYTIVDTERNKILTIDAFIYIPSKEKRVFMMQLEAMIHSLYPWTNPKEQD